MIYFTCYTRVQRAKDPSATFAKYIYKITPFSDLESYTRNNTNFLGKHNIITSFIYVTCTTNYYTISVFTYLSPLPDVLGIITYISDIKQVHVPGQLHPTMIRDITIKDIQYIYLHLFHLTLHFITYIFLLPNLY
jgi:hypothetical protein